MNSQKAKKVVYGTAAGQRFHASPHCHDRRSWIIFCTIKTIRQL
jgi:hypothetical protein